VYALDQAIGSQNFYCVPFWLNDGRVVANPDDYEFGSLGKTPANSLNQRMFADFADDHLAYSTARVSRITVTLM
jgi:hypothetical protein